MIKIDVIGGSGFIGTRLVRRLLVHGNADVQIIDKTISSEFPELSTIADVRSLAALREAIRHNSILINLAAEHRDDVKPKSLYEEVNVQGAKNICIVADEKSINSIFFTSSVAVYGFTDDEVDETGAIRPFNDYGLTKARAEKVYKTWYTQEPNKRRLVILRPTVVFGEGNRGNVYNLMKQIASNRFVMIGAGENKKSIAYVENVAASLEYFLSSPVGFHLHNYVDKPDLSMTDLVGLVRKILGKRVKSRWKIPYALGILIGFVFDFLAFITGRGLPISSIRIRKFCANSVYGSNIEEVGFRPPFSMRNALESTVLYEFRDVKEHA